jgi:hypothetical protein
VLEVSDKKFPTLLHEMKRILGTRAVHKECHPRPEARDNLLNDRAIELVGQNTLARDEEGVSMKRRLQVYV